LFLRRCPPRAWGMFRARGGCAAGGPHRGAVDVLRRWVRSGYRHGARPRQLRKRNAINCARGDFYFWEATLGAQLPCSSGGGHRARGGCWCAAGRTAALSTSCVDASEAATGTGPARGSCAGRDATQRNKLRKGGFLFLGGCLGGAVALLLRRWPSRARGMQARPRQLCEATQRNATQRNKLRKGGFLFLGGSLGGAVALFLRRWPSRAGDAPRARRVCSGRAVDRGAADVLRRRVRIGHRHGARPQQLREATKRNATQ
jgi:hypothetical protein